VYRFFFLFSDWSGYGECRVLTFYFFIIIIIIIIFIIVFDGDSTDSEKENWKHNRRNYKRSAASRKAFKQQSDKANARDLTDDDDESDSDNPTHRKKGLGSTTSSSI